MQYWDATVHYQYCRCMHHIFYILVSTMYRSNNTFCTFDIGFSFDKSEDIMQIFLSSLTVSHVQRSHLEIAPDVWKQMATDRDIKAVMGETDYINPPPSFDWNTEKDRAAKSPVHIQISSSSSRESHFKFCQISTMTQICHDVQSSTASSCLDTAMLMKKWSE